MSKTFEEVWAEKEKEGYQYGRDALENVRFGWELREAATNQGCHKCGGEVKNTDDRPSFAYCRKCGTIEPRRWTWPETWMSVARTISDRSYDPRLKVGAIIVSDDNTQVLSIGYNGNYKGGPHEHESTEPGKSGFIHAEVNALVKCDFNFPKKKHMYVTHMPCKDCAKLIINAEICRVVWETPYRITDGVELLASVGIEVFSFHDAVAAAIVKGR